MDQSYLPFLFFGTIAVIIGLVAYLGYRADQARRQALFEIAVRNGLQYSHDDPLSIPDLYSFFDWISQGDSREATNVIYGRKGNCDVKAFDYKYSTGSGKSRETHRLSFAAFDTDTAFHPLTIRPEGFLDHVAGAFGFEDINFESEEFSRKFFVKAQDKKFAYDIVQPRMMEFLLAHPGWSLQTFGRTVMICNHSIFSPQEFDAALSFLESFLALIPAYVWDGLRSDMEAR